MEDYKTKYEKAIEQAKKELQACGSLDCDAARQIFRFFPELKEKKDERIRNAIKILVKIKENDSIGLEPVYGASYKEMIAWIENVYTEDDINRAYKCADEVQYRKGYEAAKKELEKQGEKNEEDFWEKCNHCECFDGYDICLHKKNFGSVTDESKENCKNNKFFIEKQNSTEDNCKISDWDIKVDTIEYNKGFECGKQRVLKYPEDYGLCKKPAWNEEDEEKLTEVISEFEAMKNISSTIFEKNLCDDKITFLKSLKERIKGDKQ